MLQSLVGDDPPPRFFNAPRVIAAEERGMPVMDGLLGRVLELSPSQERGDLTLRICTALADQMVDTEVESRCHNLHAALFLMLDSVGVPSAFVWGSLHAETYDPRGTFALNAQVPAEGENHRPGHSWLITPEFNVVDLALKHQGAVGGTYEAVKTAIPSVVHLSNCKRDPIPRGWYPDHDGRPVSEDAYAGGTQYSDVLGWSELSDDRFTARYLPGAISAPEEDLDGINLRIGGLRPEQAFERFVVPLLNETAQ